MVRASTVRPRPLSDAVYGTGGVEDQSQSFSTNTCEVESFIPKFSEVSLAFLPRECHFFFFADRVAGVGWDALRRARCKRTTGVEVLPALSR